MTLNYAHKPNYFLYAQLFIRHVEGYIKKNSDRNNATFDLRDIYELFRQDLASTTTNLEGILNIADEYTVETINGDKKIISSYKIDAEQNTLLVDFDSDSVKSIADGKQIIAPDATLQQ